MAELRRRQRADPGSTAGPPNNMPTRDQMAESRWIKPFGTRILHSEFWRFTRRSVPRGVAMGLFVGVFFLIPGVQIIGAALFCAAGARQHPDRGGDDLPHQPVHHAVPDPRLDPGRQSVRLPRRYAARSWRCTSAGADLATGWPGSPPTPRRRWSSACSSSRSVERAGRLFHRGRGLALVGGAQVAAARAAHGERGMSGGDARRPRARRPRTWRARRCPARRALASAGLLLWAVGDPIFAAIFVAGLIGAGGLVAAARPARPMPRRGPPTAAAGDRCRPAARRARRGRRCGAGGRPTARTGWSRANQLWSDWFGGARRAGSSSTARLSAAGRTRGRGATARRRRADLDRCGAHA